jgi:hypothetical protein
MIRYALRCERGHDFESWFQNSASYDRQVRRGLVTCPACDSVKVEKAIMAPQIARKGRSARSRAAEAAGEAARAGAEASASATPQAPAPMLMSEGSELRAKLRELRDHIRKNADDVGGQFPTEARKMHYGEIAHRPIYGEASPDEAKALIEEGVEVAPLPVLPDDRN